MLKVGVFRVADGRDGKVLLVRNALPFLTYNVILSLAIEGRWEQSMSPLVIIVSF